MYAGQVLKHCARLPQPDTFNTFPSKYLGWLDRQQAKPSAPELPFSANLPSHLAHTPCSTMSMSSRQVLLLPLHLCLPLAIPKGLLPLFSTQKISISPQTHPEGHHPSPGELPSHSLPSLTMFHHSAGHPHRPDLSAETVLRKQLPTCELLERGVRLHAKPLPVLIEGPQA